MEIKSRKKSLKKLFPKWISFDNLQYSFQNTSKNNWLSLIIKNKKLINFKNINYNETKNYTYIIKSCTIYSTKFIQLLITWIINFK